MARISVIIPTRNRASMLQRAIQSAKISGSGVEVIVVDDASTDDTESICRSLTGIVYLRMQRNVGQACARNAGIARSTGEYIAFLDDDDLRLPLSLDTQAEMLACDVNLGLVHGQVQIGDSETCVPTGEIRPTHCLTGDIFWRLVEGNVIYIPSVLVRRRHMEAIGLFSCDVLGSEDWDAWLRLAAISRVGAVQKPVAVYRGFSRRSGQTSSNLPRTCRSSANLPRTCRSSALTQARALHSPRGAVATRAMRRQIQSKFMDGLWGSLIKEGNKSLSEGNIKYAAVNYLTAIRLHPGGAVRFGAKQISRVFSQFQSR